MLKPLLKKAIPLLAMIPLLGSCSLFQPKHKVIEYDEEVKLHDGSMIWVHIKRHYRLVGGGALGDPGAFEKGYMPGPVEISWDTGFPNVGRKSIFFKNVAYIGKYDNEWYVFGFTPQGYSSQQYESTSCQSVGLQVGKFGCVVIVNANGFVKTPYSNSNIEWKGWNILYPIGIKDWGSIPEPLNRQRLSWFNKLELEKTQPQNLRRINVTN